MIKILALDGLVGILNPYERAWTHKKRFNDHLDSPPEKVRELYRLIKYFDWNPPKTKYNDSRELTWLNMRTMQWENIETYNHEIINEINGFNKNSRTNEG